jgi:hypothetical protein
MHDRSPPVAIGATRSYRMKTHPQDLERTAGTAVGDTSISTGPPA